MSTSVHRHCKSLIDKDWKSYANDLPQVPRSQGICAIGLSQPSPPDAVYVPEILFVGQTSDIHRRFQEHKCQNLAIDQFVKDQFHVNGGENLLIKWVEKPNSRYPGGECLNFMRKELGYFPPYNLRYR